jgi:hypothetical protein
MMKAKGKGKDSAELPKLKAPRMPRLLD